MVADSQPTKYPKKIRDKSFRSGLLLSFHLTRKITAHTIKSPILYTVHDLYDLFITSLYAISSRQSTKRLQTGMPDKVLINDIDLLFIKRFTSV